MDRAVYFVQCDAGIVIYEENLNPVHLKGKRKTELEQRI
jgi:hypothetical protein